MSPTKPWLGKCLKNVLPHHSGCVLGCPSGNSPSCVDVLVRRHAVVEARSRRTRAGCRRRRRTTPSALLVRTPGRRSPWVSSPMSMTRVVERVDPDHTLVDVRAQCDPCVWSWNQKNDCFSRSLSARPVEIEVVDERLPRVAVTTEVLHRVVRVAVALGRGVRRCGGASGTTSRAHRSPGGRGSSGSRRDGSRTARARACRTRR